MTLVEVSTFTTLMWLIVAVTIAALHGTLPVVRSIVATALCCFALPVICPLATRVVLAFTPLRMQERAAKLAGCLSDQRVNVPVGITFFSTLAWIIVIVNFQLLFQQWPPLASLAIVVLCICLYAIALIPLGRFFEKVHRRHTR